MRARALSVAMAATLSFGCGALLGCGADEDRAPSQVAMPIIDGQPATAGELYATVALIGFSDGEPFCTGTLISPTVVVTAAHCLFSEQGPMAASDIDVASGVLDAYAATSDQLYPVASAVAHSGYNNAADPGALGRDDDIAVLVLSEPVEGQSPVPVLALEAFDEHIEAGTSLTITGYGQRDEEAVDENLFGLLYIAQTPFQERTEHEILVGGTGSPDTCTGDSGGPVYIDIDGTKYVTAAVSRASEAGSPPCGRGGVYTLAGAYDAFLVDNSGGAYSGAMTPTAASGPATSSSSSGGGDDDEDDSDGCSVGGGSSDFGWLWVLALGLATRSRRRCRAVSR